MRYLRVTQGGEDLSLSILTPRDAMRELAAQRDTALAGYADMTSFAGVLLVCVVLLLIVAAAGWARVWGWY